MNTFLITFVFLISLGQILNTNPVYVGPAPSDIVLKFLINKLII